MLQPKSDWFWFTDDNQLMLSMGEEWLCTTAYNKKHIVDLPKENQAFSLRDTECYLSLGNILTNSGIDFSEAQLTHILINATAALMFHKPVTPKSWFFEEVELCGTHHKLGNLNNSYGCGTVLQLTDEGQLVTCMVISDNLQLNQHKSIARFELVKVAKARLSPFLHKSNSQLSA